jgi:alkanesulfonate monooxygenase SsuD/methylene tetrahydromethanopterin reductase-like flavin-dependent oxidoreductase (luciferase family)
LEYMHVGYEAAFQHRASYPDDVFMRKEFDFCLRAESLGFDSIWLTEHHFSGYGLIPDPLQALSYLSGRTERIKLGTAVLVLPWHDPVRLTEQIILTDHISGGRLVIGIGRGLSKHEFEGFRIPLDESRARFNENAQLIFSALQTAVPGAGQGTAPATVIYGTPDQVLTRLDELKRLLGLQGILAIFHGIPDADGERSLDCFAKHCLAELKSWPAELTF